MIRAFLYVIFTLFSICLNAECFTIDYNGNGFDICPDSNGDIIINLDAEPWKSSRGTFTIPIDQEISCRNFEIYGKNDNYENIHIINDGKIECSGICNIGRGGYTYSIGTSRSDNKTIFTNSQYGSIIAEEINVRYRYSMPEFEGVWKSSGSFNVISGQGQNLKFGENCSIRAEKIYINCNISDKVIIEGDIAADQIQSTKKISVETNGTITVGEITKIPWQASIIVHEGGTLNLCKNPTSGSDDLGFISGTILYNTSEWQGTDPESEGDINYKGSGLSWIWNQISGNSNFKAKSSIGAYNSYESCMENKPDISVLGIENDDRIQNNRVFKPLYGDTNPCSDEYKSTRYFINGIWVRVINGETIYCESDN